MSRIAKGSGRARTADVDSLLKQLKEAIAHLPQLMQMVGAVLLRLAELGATRAEVLIREGETAYRVRLCSRGSSAKSCDR